MKKRKPNPYRPLTVYTLHDELMASDNKPLPQAQRTHHLSKMHLALHAMTEAIHERNRMTVATRQPLTKKQQAAVQRANAILEDAGIWAGYGWTSAAAHEVAQAGIDAVLAYAKAPKAQEKK